MTQARYARLLVAITAVLQGCAPVATQTGAETGTRVNADTALMIPAGFGSLRQDDIALPLQLFGLQVRAIPLDESVIRALSPDSYRALSDLVRSQRDRLEEIRRRTAHQKLSLWYVSFFGVETGEARYSPMELIVTNVGRDFRPIDVIPLSPGFGLQRVRQREAQHGLYVFDGQLDVNQPLTLTYETGRATGWPSVLERIERERAIIRSRARQGQPARESQPSS